MTGWGNSGSFHQPCKAEEACVSPQPSTAAGQGLGSLRKVGEFS
jgi:hypothetical protein